MAKGKKVAKKVVDQLLEGAIAGAKKGSKRAKVPRHTGKVDIDVTGRGSFREFDFDDAVKVLKAKDFAENREAAAEAAEEASQKMGARATDAGRVLDGDRAEARRLRAEADAAVGTDEAAAKAKLAEAAEAKAKLSQEKFQTLDDEAARTKAVALRRRNEADEAANHLTTIEGQTGAAERQRAIDAAIKQAEARAAQIAREERADTIIGNLDRYAAEYQQAMRDKAQATANIKEAEKVLAQARLNLERPGVDREIATAEIQAAEKALEEANGAWKEATKIYLQKNGVKNNWRKNAREFLAEEDEAATLEPRQVDAVRRALEEADNAGKVVAAEKEGKNAPYIINRLETFAAELDQAGVLLQRARVAKREADEALAAAQTTGEGVEIAQAKADLADAEFKRLEVTYNGKVGGVTRWRLEAQKLIARTDDAAERELLENAISQAVPTVSLPDRVMEAAAEHEQVYIKLAQAQDNWRKAVKETSASDNPNILAAAQAVKEAKKALKESDQRVNAFNQRISRALRDPRLPAEDRTALESASAAVKAVNEEHEALYILDNVAEYGIKREANLRARNEAAQALEAAEKRFAKGEGTQAEVHAAQAALARAEAQYQRSRISHDRWQNNYDHLLSPEERVATKVNEKAMRVASRLETALEERGPLTARKDEAFAAMKQAEARVKELELAGDPTHLASAQTEAQAAAEAFRRAELDLHRNYIIISNSEGYAQALVRDPDKVLDASNRQKLEAALARIKVGDRKPTDQADCLRAVAEVRDLDYEAVAKAQKEMREAREYLAEARRTGDDTEGAEAEFEKAAAQLAEAEDNLRSSALSVNERASDLNQLLEREDLPNSDRQAIQGALDEAERLKAAREPELIRGNLAEKAEQSKEAYEALKKARAIRDQAQRELDAAKETGDETQIRVASGNLAEALEKNDHAEKWYAAKNRVHRWWQQKAIATGVIVAATVAVVGETVAAEVSEMPKGLGQETEADRKAWEEAQLRAFAQKNSKEWQDAKAEYEAANKAVFPEGTDNDEAIGYINLASVEQMEALNQATLRLSQAEDLVEAQVQALKKAREEARAEAAQRAEAADHLLVARHANRKLHEANEGLEAIPTTARELLARQRTNEKDLEAARAAVELAESGEQALHIMRNSSSSFFEGTSAEEIVTLEVANKEQLELARAELARAEAEAKTIAEAHAKLASDGKNLEELAAGEEVQSRVQEARLVGAQIAANQTEHDYVQERVRLQREDPETGIGDWAQEILVKRAEREAKREARLAKAAKGIVEPISDEEKELGFGYDPKTGNFTDFEGPFIMRTTNSLAAKYGPEGANLADPRFLVWFVENYDKLPAAQQALWDEILPPELKEFALIAYDFYKADEVRDEMELDRMLSKDMYGPSIVIPDQKTHEEKPEDSPDSRLAKTKEMDGGGSKKAAWDTLEVQTPASQNYTPNVWESPDVNYSGDDGAYETAMSVEQSMEQASAQPTTSGPRLY